MFEYQGETKTYTQKTLVWAQVLQLAALLEGTEMGMTGTPKDIISMLDTKLFPAMAIVLVEKGVPLREKDLKILEDDLKYELPITEATKIVQDFFDCNPISSLLEEIAGAVAKMNPVTLEPGELLKKSSSDLPAGT